MLFLVFSSIYLLLTCFARNSCFMRLRVTQKALQLPLFRFFLFLFPVTVFVYMVFVYFLSVTAVRACDQDWTY